jgi:hypothetical protein
MNKKKISIYVTSVFLSIVFASLVTRLLMVEQPIGMEVDTNFLYFVFLPLVAWMNLVVQFMIALNLCRSTAEEVAEQAQIERIRRKIDS